MATEIKFVLSAFLADALLAWAFYSLAGWLDGRLPVDELKQWVASYMLVLIWALLCAIINIVLYRSIMHQ